MWKLYTCPTCFRHFWKNKQVHICNYKVKKSHVGPSAYLANWVLKQSALMLLSKSRLWLLNQSLHLEKIKKYNKKSKWIWNQSGLSWQCSDSELRAVSAFQTWRDICKACICTGRISLIHILGARWAVCNTPYGPRFLELHSHERFPIDHVIFFFLLCLKPAGSSPEIQYTPPVFFRYATEQKRFMKRNSCADTSRSCCSYRFKSVHLHGAGWLEICQGREYPGTSGL